MSFLLFFSSFLLFILFSFSAFFGAFHFVGTWLEFDSRIVVAAMVRTRKRGLIVGADGESSGELEALLVPRCNVWHLRNGQHFLSRKRCGRCGAFKRVRLARCIYTVQHGLGFVVQVRMDEECQGIARMLMEVLGNKHIVALVLDLDHGGSVAGRGRLSSAVARTLLARIEGSVDRTAELASL